MLVDYVLAGVAEVWARRRRGPLEEKILFRRRAVAQVRMIRSGDNFLRSPNDPFTAHGMKLLQPFRDHRDICGTDPEEPVAAKRAPAAALQILRLRFRNAAKERVSAFENPCVVVVCHA